MNTCPQRLIKAEYYSLCLLAVSLPIIEVTKNIACVLLLVFFLIRFTRHRESINQNDFGKYILIFLIGSIIAAIGASINGYNVHKISDIIRYSLMGWILLYIPITKKQTYTLLWLLIVSTAIAVLHAYWSIYTKAELYFELHSVGHINHSAIYILLALGAALPFLTKKKISKIAYIILIALILILIKGLFDTHSRAAFFVLGVILIAITLFSLANNKIFSLIAIGVIISVSTYLAYNPINVMKKIQKGSTMFSSVEKTPREKLWHTAGFIWKKEPLFGIGYGNYGNITSEDLQSWFPSSNIDFTDKTKFMYLSHTHNRFVNTLAEGGAIGFLALLALLSGIAIHIWRYKRSIFKNGNQATFWLIGFNTLTIIVVVGIFNTTLHHEHALLSMILLGLSFNHLHKTKHNET